MTLNDHRCHTNFNKSLRLYDISIHRKTDYEGAKKNLAKIPESHRFFFVGCERPNILNNKFCRK